MALAAAVDLQSELANSGKPIYVRPEELRIDNSYQPPERHTEPAIRRMAHNWNSLLAGATVGSLRRDGYIYLIDGGRRRAAAIRHNQLVADDSEPDWATIPGLWCIVHSGLTVQQEADAFEELNHERKAVHSVARFFAQLTARNVESLHIRDVLADHGLAIGYTPTATQISSIEVVRVLLRWEVLEQTLSIVQDAWYENAEAHKRDPLLAIGAFELIYGAADYSRQDLAAICFGMKPEELVREARTALLEPTTYSLRTTWARVTALLREEYNAGLSASTKRLPEFEQPRLPSARSPQRLAA